LGLAQALKALLVICDVRLCLKAGIGVPEYCDTEQFAAECILDESYLMVGILHQAEV
jgi:hypothetical protein